MGLDEITVLEVDRYRLALVQHSRLGTTSINMTLTTLAAILETAVEYELIDRNPAKGPRRRLPAVKPKRVWLDRADHISALLDAAGELDRTAKTHPGRRRALIATLVFAGLRLGEALALRWSDIDLHRNTLQVIDSKTDAGVRNVNLLPSSPTNCAPTIAASASRLTGSSSRRERTGRLAPRTCANESCNPPSRVPIRTSESTAS